MIKEVNDFNSLKNLRLMYIATRLFLDMYKEDPITSAHIVFLFQLMSYRSNCWDVMIKQYDQSNYRFCTLLVYYVNLFISIRIVVLFVITK